MERERIVGAVRDALEPAPWALALWEGGSASFGRVDAWSDVDLGIGVEDGRVDEAFLLVEAALEGLAGIQATWLNPADRPKHQRYYRLRGAAPLVDVGVFPLSTPPSERFVERRRHGTPRVLFDRADFTADVPPDPAAWRERLRRRVADARGRFEMLGDLAMKSAHRGESAEAVVFFQAFVLRPLVEVLRIRHDPWRHDFDVRYLRFDLPEPARSRIQRLWYVRNQIDLREKHAEASEWLRQELASLDVDRVPLD
jgi:hypothetical protein